MNPAAASVAEFEGVYLRFAAFVRRSLGRFGARSCDVEDLTHEVFVALHRKGCSFENDKAARAWLYQAARRVASNDRRSRTRAEARAPAWSPAAVVDPEEHVQTRSAVGRFASALTDDARAVFKLSIFDGLPAPEIASRLGLNLNTTYSHIRRVRSRLARAVVGGIALLLVLAALLAGTCEARSGGAELRVASVPGDASSAG